MLDHSRLPLGGRHRGDEGRPWVVDGGSRLERAERRAARKQEWRVKTVMTKSDQTRNASSAHTASRRGARHARRPCAMPAVRNSPLRRRSFSAPTVAINQVRSGFIQGWARTTIFTFFHAWKDSHPSSTRGQCRVSDTRLKLGCYRPRPILIFLICSGN